MADIPKKQDVVRQPMQLLDCSVGQGNATHPNLLLLTLGDPDGTIYPMMISRYDAKNLLLMTASALAQMGDRLAQDIMIQFFAGNGERTPTSRGRSASATDPHPLNVPSMTSSPVVRSAHRPSPREQTDQWCRPLTDRAKTIAKCTIQYGRDYRARNVFFVLGGYADGTSTFFLARRTGHSGNQDGIFKFLAPKEVALWRDDSDDWLPDIAWPNFLFLPQGKPFFHNTKQWRKLRKEEIASMIHGRTFKSSGGRHRPDSQK